MYEYNAVITNVVDGDTFDLDIDLGFHIWIRERVRLLNIDCPEKNARNGQDEKRAGLYVTEWAKRELSGRKVVITTFKTLRTDSFGRWLVNMYVDLDNSLAPIDDTYNARGFNKRHPNYNLDKLLAKIDAEKSNSFDF